MTPTAFEILRREEAAFILYFSGAHCEVCHALYPKLKKLISAHFPHIRLIRIEAPDSRALAGQLRMLSIPGILLFLDGREVMRANGLISLDALHRQILRPYEMRFPS